MQMNGKVLAGTTMVVNGKNGKSFDKTRLKVQDVGSEMDSDIQWYWIDFIGNAALTDDEVESILHEEVVIEIHRVSASNGKDGRAFFNINGGPILLGSMPVQSKLVAATEARIPHSLTYQNGGTSP
jgi:hypothetical protein